MESAQVEFLWKAMTLLPRNQESSNILHCHYMSVVRSLDGEGDVQIPTKYTQKSAMCQYCSNIWKNGKYSIQVLPERMQPKSIKKIMSRYNKNPSCLRKFEVGLARKYARRKNILVITCGVCHKETKLDTFKPERKVKSEKELFIEEWTVNKKKRRSRDRTAGLKIPPNFHIQGKLDKKHEKAAVNYNTNDSPSSHLTPKKKKGIVENKNAGFANDFTISKANKKNKKLLKDTHDQPENKYHCRPKILKVDDNSSQRSALSKMMKNNKMSNIFSNAGPSPESPLSKFLSSL